MQAQGNDFVILDGISDTLPELTQSFIQNICHRYIGIGCDQLLVLQSHESVDALMLIYNADGSLAANCGNGLRCVGDLLMDKLKQDSVSIALADRVVQARRAVNGVSVAMGNAEIEQVTEDYTDVLIGNPHRVYFQNPQDCPERNVEIISEYDEEHAAIRIIERGTGETLACGSGACATAIAIWQKIDMREPLIISMSGGQAIVAFEKGSIYLEGSVERVFTGIYQSC